MTTSGYQPEESRLASCTHTASKKKKKKELALGVGTLDSGLWLESGDRLGRGSSSHMSKCKYLRHKIWCHLKEMPGGLQDLCLISGEIC